jgi:predicted cupin superfamily sugar epimerase
MKESAVSLIETLKLEPHREGGWFRRTYESDQMIEVPGGSRPCGTSILYLLKKGEFSRLHSLRSDETWYFHQGNPLELNLFGKGECQSVRLGDAICLGEVPQVTLPAGTIFGAVPLGAEEWSLLSCSVSPGFDYADLIWPDVEELIKQYPNEEALIKRLAPLP